jgi:hypothetical protein
VPNGERVEENEVGEVREDIEEERDEDEEGK